MRIDSYSFGRLVVDGRVYTSDVIVYPDRVDASWWREEGHCLRIADLKELLAARPSVLIIGTGYAGALSVSEPARDAIHAAGIELHVERTGRAVGLYNELSGRKAVAAALHLTC